ncbi:MAG: restriction endonuclease [Alphaproteobacteria bacterium]|nr:restriction endonuclease [Alphaproteobacteria bacterium]
MIPNYQQFMLPVLKSAANGAVNISDVVNKLADEMHISDEDRKIKISSGSSLLYGRVSWAKTYLLQAGLLESVGRGLFKATNEGLSLLSKNPKEINNKTLEKYPSFNAFKKRSKKSKENTSNIIDASDLDELSPEEAIHQSLENLNSSLANELITRILKANPTFFENLIIKLLIAMGYSNNTDEGWEHTGKTGDDGIDGVINQDVLGVDKIYIQAKRYADNHSVTAGDLRNFIGALDMCRAVKGVFVTTSSFTADARNTVKKASKNIVLIDGAQLTQLMIKYSVGCKTKETINIQKIDEDFFEEM